MKLILLPTKSTRRSVNKSEWINWWMILVLVVVVCCCWTELLLLFGLLLLQSKCRGDSELGTVTGSTAASCCWWLAERKKNCLVNFFAPFIFDVTCCCPAVCEPSWWPWYMYHDTIMMCVVGCWNLKKCEKNFFFKQTLTFALFFNVVFCGAAQCAYLRTYRTPSSTAQRMGNIITNFIFRLNEPNVHEYG